MEYTNCVKCGKPKELGEECPHCGVYYAKAEAKLKEMREKESTFNWRPSSLAFHYVDAEGEHTEREVDNAYRFNFGNNHYIRGACRLRKATRTFRADRITGEIVDINTGEVVDPLKILEVDPPENLFNDEEQAAITEETASDRWSKASSDDKEAVRKLGAWAAAALVVFILWAWPSPNDEKHPQAPKQKVSATSRSAVEVNLGYLPAPLTSQDQATTLLDLIAKNPGRNPYQLTYKTADNVVIFGCNLDKNIIVRMHNYNDGSGSAESWHGNVRYRLQQAAAGNSLNDTPGGNSPGTFTRF